jgi:hypothetical protein
VRRCKIPIQYTQSDNPNNSLFNDSVTLNPYRDFTTQGPNVWFGSTAFGKYTIWVTQKRAHAEVSADDVKIEPQNPHEKDCLITTSAGQIAEGFNKFFYDRGR